MKIKVKNADGFHSGEEQPHEPGQIAHAAFEPANRRFLGVVPTIVISAFVAFGAVAFLVSLGSEDQSANSTATPQALQQSIPAQHTGNKVLNTAELCKEYNLPLPTDSNGNPVELWGTNALATETIQAHSAKSETGQSKLSPQDRGWLIKQGFDPDSFVSAGQEQEQPKFNGIAVIVSFAGMANFVIPSDYVISMKVNSIRFKFNGQTYDISGHFAVMLNKPRKHSNPLFGLGTPEKAKLVTMNEFGGETTWLPDATIWEKSDGFIDFEAMGKEWIYSGDYTIQN